MKKTVILGSLFSMIFMIACGSSQPAVKETPVVQTNVDHKVWVTATNKELERIPVAGFEYKGSDMPSWKWDAWAKTSAPVVKKIISEMPEGYVFQVTGHTDARGPEEPEGDKPGKPQKYPVTGQKQYMMPLKTTE